MKNARRIWEPATERQKDYIFLLADKQGIPDTEIMGMIGAVASIPDPELLSKMEASYLIDRLKGSTEWDRPRPPAREDLREEDTTAMPSAGHVEGIRRAFRDLDWGPEKYLLWLNDRLKVASLADLDRDGARSGYLQLTEILKRRN